MVTLSWWTSHECAVPLERGERFGRGGNDHGVVSTERKIDHDNGEHGEDELPVRNLME